MLYPFYAMGVACTGKDFGMFLIFAACSIIPFALIWLAEVLGVSVGAVYKWESRSSLPELRLIMEMADFFDVSVDALLGYKMKDNHLNETVERLWQASRGRDYMRFPRRRRRSGNTRIPSMWCMQPRTFIIPLARGPERNPGFGGPLSCWR
ncbi:MAG: helix-turn-helix transcriptional regulator, partial [Acidaminococcaceae bacterium]|nr:helix-turn-helix transcriptional regulator [Acidaminococcaceae bacterium]